VVPVPSVSSMPQLLRTFGRSILRNGKLTCEFVHPRSKETANLIFHSFFHSLSRKGLYCSTPVSRCELLTVVTRQ
jgi:hypothetical protein